MQRVTLHFNNLSIWYVFQQGTCVCMCSGKVRMYVFRQGTYVCVPAWYVCVPARYVRTYVYQQGMYVFQQGTYVCVPAIYICVPARYVRVCSSKVHMCSSKVHTYVFQQGTYVCAVSEVILDHWTMVSRKFSKIITIRLVFHPFLHKSCLSGILCVCSEKSLGGGGGAAKSEGGQVPPLNVALHKL